MNLARIAVAVSAVIAGLFITFRFGLMASLSVGLLIGLALGFLFLAVIMLSMGRDER